MVGSVVLEIPAQEAKGGVPLSPMLGQFQVNVTSFCKEFNDVSARFVKGLPLRCRVFIFSNGVFKFSLEGLTFRFIFFEFFIPVSFTSIENSLTLLFDCFRLFFFLKGDVLDKAKSKFLFSYLQTLPVRSLKNKFKF